MCGLPSSSGLFPVLLAYVTTNALSDPAGSSPFLCFGSIPNRAYPWLLLLVLGAVSGLLPVDLLLGVLLGHAASAQLLRWAEPSARAISALELGPSLLVTSGMTSARSYVYSPETALPADIRARREAAAAAIGMAQPRRSLTDAPPAPITASNYLFRAARGGGAQAAPAGDAEAGEAGAAPGAAGAFPGKGHTLTATSSSDGGGGGGGVARSAGGGAGAGLPTDAAARAALLRASAEARLRGAASGGRSGGAPAPAPASASAPVSAADEEEAAALLPALHLAHGASAGAVPRLAPPPAGAGAGPTMALRPPASALALAAQREGEWADSVALLVSMGWPSERSDAALAEAGGDLDAAILALTKEGDGAGSGGGAV